MTERFTGKVSGRNMVSNGIYGMIGKCGRYFVGEAIDKLAEYETAEDEGRLVVLPCKVGQCVYTNFSMSGWYMRRGKRPYIGRIVFIGLNADDPYFNIILGEGKMLQFKFSEIGKRVFLAREEAEKALKEMEVEICKEDLSIK